MSEINVKEKLEAIVWPRAMDSIDRAGDLNALNDVRVSVLGKKGELTAVLKGMKDVAPEDRPKSGPAWSMTPAARLKTAWSR